MGTRWLAEIGGNHNGDLTRAIALIRQAAAAGFDAVKFQLASPDRLFHTSALVSRPDLLARTRLPLYWMQRLQSIAHHCMVTFGLSIFDERDIQQAESYVDFWKVSSYDLLRLDLIAKLRWRPLILSTGMASMEECLEARRVALASDNPEVTFLHCVSCYPTHPGNANLKAIDLMQKMLCTPVGWSDHTACEDVIERAVWRWRASTVELHVDLDDGEGEESRFGHCWKMSRAAALLERMKGTEIPADLPRGSPIDGHGEKMPNMAEMRERLWRADPKDGLRPLEEIRASLKEG